MHITIVFLLEDQCCIEADFFQERLKVKVASISKGPSFSKQVKKEAMALLSSLCCLDIDLCLSCICDKAKRIDTVVESAMHGRSIEIESSELRYLYDTINKLSNQFQGSLRAYNVSEGTIQNCVSDVVQSLKNHIKYFVY